MRTVRDRSRDANRRRFLHAPFLERLEARDLPTFTLIHHAAVLAPGELTALQQQVALQAQSSASSTSGSATSSGTSAGVPTRHEIARQTFVGRFKGSYLLGPGRFTDQAAQITSLGYGGGNRTLHMLTNMRITLPADPQAPVTGVIYIVSPNVATTGSTLILDLTGDPSSSVNGLPTRYTWTVDPASGGIFTNAGGYGAGQGTMNIRFFPARKGPSPALESGQLQFSVNGHINTSGVFNPIGVLGNIPKQP
jgi:hypothetical protein